MNYPIVLPFSLPPRGTLAFYRGSMGISIPGAPVIPGGNAQNPDHMMTCLLDNYPPDWQDRFLRQFAEDGFDHLQRSIGHAIYYGKSLEDYNRLSKKAKGYGLYCDHWFLGGGEEGSGNGFRVHDADASYWGPFLEPYIASIQASGTLDHACVGWQLDQFNVPGNPILSIIAWLGDRLPQTVPLFTHWVNEALAWWLTGGQVWSDAHQTINVLDRFTFWQACQPYLTGGFHQANNEMAINNPKLYQDKLLDTLDAFGGDRSKGSMGQSWRGGIKNFAMDVYEVTEQFRFNGRKTKTLPDGEVVDDGPMTDTIGDQATWGGLATTSHTGHHIGGYGDGCRQPSGVAA